MKMKYRVFQPLVGKRLKEICSDRWWVLHVYRELEGNPAMGRMVASLRNDGEWVVRDDRNVHRFYSIRKKWEWIQVGSYWSEGLAEEYPELVMWLMEKS